MRRFNFFYCAILYVICRNLFIKLIINSTFESCCQDHCLEGNKKVGRKDSKEMNSVIKVGLLLLIACCLLVSSQPEGWRMVDRFYGFRYELSGRNLDAASILESILNEADNYACFGWAQISPAGSIVGEARCAKARGKIFQEKLKNISPQISKTEFLVRYLLHFSCCSCIIK